MPDPFTFVNGQHVRTKHQWQCRRQELIELFQRYELGELPGQPNVLSSSYDTGNLTITAGTGDASITFSVNITLPTSGTGPFPAIIAYGGLSVPVPESIATVVFDNSAFAEQNNLSSRGVGLFYDLFGHNATASAPTAWSWGASRIIDALEMTPNININTKKLALTGCSRNGKGVSRPGDQYTMRTLNIAFLSAGSGCWCFR